MISATVAKQRLESIRSDIRNAIVEKDQSFNAGDFEGVKFWHRECDRLAKKEISYINQHLIR